MDPYQIRRGVMYIRESTKEQGKGFAPQTQEQAMRSYAEKNQIDLTFSPYKDLVSGRHANNRSEFQRMMGDAAAHKFEIVLVYHTSRFARNLEEARYHKRILREKLSIDVISVSQPFGDWNDPNAFFNESMNEVMDEQTSRVISFLVRGTLSTKRAAGNQLGNPPFGYFKERLGYDEETKRALYDKKWKIHEQYGSLVQELFTKYATGRYSFADLAQDLNKRGFKTQLGNPFTYSSIKDILNNKAYCGTTYSPRKDLPEIPAKHPALIAAELYDQVQTMIGQRNYAHGRPTAQHRFYLLQGVIYCYKCRHNLNSNNSNPNAKMLPRMYCETPTRGALYGCKMRRECKNCSQPDVLCKTIDDQVLKFMRGFSMPDDVVELTIQKLNGMIPTLPKSPDTITKIKNLEEKLKRISRTYADGNLDEDTYNTDAQRVKNELLTLGAAPQTSINYDSSKDFVAAAERLLCDFPALFDHETPEVKRQWILLTIKRVWVENDKVVVIEPHDKFKKLFPPLQEVLGQAPLATPYCPLISTNAELTTYN